VLKHFAGAMLMATQNERTIRYGIIGTGRIANDFAEDLVHVSGAVLHSVLSREKVSAQNFAAKHGAAASYDAINEFLSDPSLDAVYVASPNSAHLPQALACIRARKPAIIEKPIALNAQHARIILDESVKYGVPVMEGMWIRFLPGIIRAREIVRGGELGQVKEVNGALAYYHSFDPQNRLFNKALGGGAALDLGVYLLSLSLFLFGTPEHFNGSWVAGQSGVDESSAFALHYPSFKANLSASFAKTGGNTFEIVGTDGVLRLEDPFIQARRLRVLRGNSANLNVMRPPVHKPASLIQRALRTLPLPGQTVTNYRYPGHGLQFEASAFAEMTGGRGLHEVSSLSDSIAVLQIVDRVLSGAPSTPKTG
jgi:predicted dehydrogenase